MTTLKKPLVYDESRHCGGIKKSDGLPCTQRKGWGTDHARFGRCKLHGGASESGRKAGQLLAAENAAARLGAPVDTNPFDALAHSLAIENGFVEFFRREVERIDPDCHFVRPTSILRRPLSEGKGEDPGVMVEEITEAPLDLHIAIKALERWLAARDKTSKIIINAGLAERIVKMQEAQSQALFVAVRSIVLALGHKLDDPRVQGIVTKHLAAIDVTSEEA